MTPTSINRYTCDTCEGFITTVHRDEGTTPMILKCRATPGCSGSMQSAMYQVDQTLIPDYEWYAPSRDEVARLSRDMKQHVKMGGLLIRRVNDSGTVTVTPAQPSRHALKKERTTIKAQRVTMQKQLLKLQVQQLQIFDPAMSLKIATTIGVLNKTLSQTKARLAEIESLLEGQGH